MPIRIKCPKCALVQEVSDSAAGKVAECLGCQARFAVPAKKICCRCQKDVSRTRRAKDQQGNYYCESCMPEMQAWAAKAAVAPPPPPPLPAANVAEVTLAPRQVALPALDAQIAEIKAAVEGIGKEAAGLAKQASDGVWGGCGCCATMLPVWLGLCNGLDWQWWSSGLLAAALSVGVGFALESLVSSRRKTKAADGKDRLARAFQGAFSAGHPQRAAAVYVLCDALSQGGPEPAGFAAYYPEREKYGAACREWLTVLTGTGEMPVPELTAKLDAPDLAVRTRAAEWLSFTAGSALTEPLRAAFDGSDKKTMYHAAASLVRIAKQGDREAAAVLSALASRPAGDSGVVAREAEWFLQTDGKGTPPDFTKPAGAAAAAGGAVQATAVKCPKCGLPTGEIRSRALVARGAGSVVGGIVGSIVGAAVGAPEVGAAIGWGAGAGASKEGHCTRCDHTWPVT